MSRIFSRSDAGIIASRLQRLRLAAGLLRVLDAALSCNGGLTV